MGRNINGVWYDYPILCPKCGAVFDHVTNPYNIQICKSCGHRDGESNFAIVPNEPTELEQVKAERDKFEKESQAYSEEISRLLQIARNESILLKYFCRHDYDDECGSTDCIACLKIKALKAVEDA